MHGMTVIELANVLAGPSVGQFLAELGATVIKVESPLTKGDVTRTWKLKSEGKDDNVSAYFSCCNLGKKSISVDMASEKGTKVIHSLVKKADCVVASFKPGDAEKLRVDGKTLCSLNPKLVYAQITGYGLDNKRVGYDAVVQAESGFQYMNGFPDREPCKMPVALVDVLTAHQLKQAVLVALWRRERTGLGGAVNVSLMGSAVAALANQATGYLREGAIPKRIGSDHPSIAPYGTVFETRLKDQQVTLGVGSNSQFKSLCKIIGQPELAEQGSKFATNRERCAHREELKAILREALQGWTRKDLLAELEANNVPAGGINDMKSVFEIPSAQELVVYPRSGHHGQARAIGLRQVAFKGSPEGLQADDCSALSEPPAYGQHTKQVLDELGYSKHEMDQLFAERVVE